MAKKIKLNSPGGFLSRGKDGTTATGIINSPRLIIPNGATGKLRANKSVIFDDLPKVVIQDVPEHWLTPNDGKAKNG